MGEKFDLTFFIDKKKARQKQTKSQLLNILGLEEGRNLIANHQCSLLADKEVFFYEYDYEEVDYILYMVCFDELIFKEAYLKVTINQFLDLIEPCFSQLSEIFFATGIYELTYEYIKEVNHIEDFNTEVFSKYPILFFRKGQEYDFKPFCSRNDVSCVVNTDRGRIQDIFAII